MVCFFIFAGETIGFAGNFGRSHGCLVPYPTRRGTHGRGHEWTPGYRRLPGPLEDPVRIRSHSRPRPNRSVDAGIPTTDSAGSSHGQKRILIILMGMNLKSISLICIKEKVILKQAQVPPPVSILDSRHSAKIDSFALEVIIYYISFFLYFLHGFI